MDFSYNPPPGSILQWIHWTPDKGSNTQFWRVLSGRTDRIEVVPMISDKDSVISYYLLESALRAGAYKVITSIKDADPIAGALGL